MKLAVPIDDLKDLVMRQLKSYFDVSQAEEEIVSSSIKNALDRCCVCFQMIDNKCFRGDGGG
jgi:DNA topoisomerase IB